MTALPDQSAKAVLRHHILGSLGAERVLEYLLPGTEGNAYNPVNLLS